MIVYLGFFNIFFGMVFLLIPLIFLELGRPKDLIRAGLNLIIGLTLIVKSKVFENSYSAIYLLVTLLFTLYVFEIFTSRWNMLTDKEKNRFTNVLEFKKNLSKLSEALYLAINNLKNSFDIFQFVRNNKNLEEKKWVRKDENDRIES